MARARLNVPCWQLAELVARVVPQRARVALAQRLAPMEATPTLGVTAARPQLAKLALLPPWLLPPAAAEAVAANLLFLRCQTRVREAWVMPLALLAVKPLVARLVALAWVATVVPTRRLPKAQEPGAAEVVRTLLTQAAQVALVETRVAVVAGAVRL